MNRRGASVAWGSISLTFNGEPIAATAITYTPKRAPHKRSAGLVSCATSGTYDVILKRSAWRRFVRTLRYAHRYRASFETLMRRASYGGRKGRRAMRRLMAMSDGAWKAGLS